MFVAVVAFLVRIIPLLAGPGLLAWGRYDDGVYYTASAALLDGHVPYRDFVLLHPPLIMLVLLPFTLLGRLTSDPTGLVTARLVWMLLGTSTAVLAARFAGRWGTLPALFAGLWVACSSASVFASQTTFIEPAADVALFGALILLSCESERPRHELAAGVLLGLALTGKIWYVAPVGVLLVVMLLQRRWRGVARAGGAAAVVAGAVLVPFFAMAPHEMWHMVVYDQLSRPVAAKASLINRLGIAVGGRFLGLSTGASHAITVAAGLAALAGALRCVADRQARLVGAIALTTVIVLLASPSSFHHYGSFSAAPVAVSLAVGWCLLGRQLAGPRLVRSAAAIVAVAAVAVSGLLVLGRPAKRELPVAGIEAVLPPGCITTDNPLTLIVTDRLSSNLRANCPLAVDITGASYGAHERRTHNMSYLDWLTDYLTSGQAIILARHEGDGLEQRAVRSLGTVIYRSGFVQVFRPGP